MSFLSFSEDSENTNFSTFFSSLPLTEVHGRVSSNGRSKRERERGKHAHINQQFSFMNRKIGRFLLAYEERKNVPCCQGNSHSLGSCNRNQSNL